jgi:ATP:ADP antiporter, AAA family
MASTIGSAAGSDEPGRHFARRAFATIFLILAAHSLTETARDALFLSRLPVTQLPWMYLLVAVASILVARVTIPNAARLRHSTLPPLLLGSAVVSCVLWIAGGSRSTAFLYVLYLWPGVFGSVVVVEFWRTVSDAYTIVEAKRVFGRVGAGGTAGAVVGSGLAVVLATSLPARHLLLAAGAVLLTAAALTTRLSASPAQPPTAPGIAPPASPLRTIRKDRYLRGLAACLFLATVTATLSDFVFKGILTREVPAADLARVFAGVSLGVNLGSLVLQMTVVGPLIRRLGVTRSLAVLPSALSLAAAGLFASAGLVTAIVMRMTDNTLRYSIHRATADLLYVPLSPVLRARTKTVIDVLSQRVGQIAGSAAILAVWWSGGSYRAVAATIVLLAAATVAIAIRLTQPYLDLFRSTLRTLGTDTRLALPTMNLESLTSLVAAFSSEDDRAVVAAMDLAADQRGIAVIPVVMLFHPSRAVVLRALELFEQHRREGWGWALHRLSQEARDPQIRAAALTAHAYREEDDSALRAAQNDPDEMLRVTALTGLISGGWIEGDAATQALSEALARASVYGRVSLAAAMRSRPSPVFEAALLQLADTDDLGVRAGVADAMAQAPSPQFLGPLRDMLSESRLREPARRALVATGRPAFDFLAHSLDDDTLPRAIRMHLPRSLSRFTAGAAVPALWRRLLAEPDDLIRFKLLRSIGRLVTEDPAARPDAGAIADAIHHFSRTGLRYAGWRAALEREAAPAATAPTAAVLTQLLADKQHRAAESVFRLLALDNPREDFERIYRGLHGNRLDRASGRELLDGLVPAGTRDIVLALLEDPADPTQLARLGAPDIPAGLDSDETVAAIVQVSTGALRAVALRHAEDVGLMSRSDRRESHGHHRALPRPVRTADSAQGDLAGRSAAGGGARGARHACD